MRSTRSDDFSFLAYLLILSFQFPVWMLAGAFWAFFMVTFSGFRPINAFVGGLYWGLAMWVVMGNFLAIGCAWRRSVTFPAADRETMTEAIKEASEKVKLKILSESDSLFVLGPKWALVRFRLQEVHVEFEEDESTISAPALSLGRFRKALKRALAERMEF